MRYALPATRLINRLLGETVQVESRYEATKGKTRQKLQMCAWTREMNVVVAATWEQVKYGGSRHAATIYRAQIHDGLLCGFWSGVSFSERFEPTV